MIHETSPQKNVVVQNKENLIKKRLEVQNDPEASKKALELIKKLNDQKKLQQK